MQHCAKARWFLVMSNETTEVVSAPLEESAVETETQPDGNLSMSDYVASIMTRGEETESEAPEGQAEAEEESAEQAAEAPEAEEPEDVPEESSQEEPPAETSTDVLSKLGINLDDMSEEDAKALSKALNASAVKRFGKLTAQKKALIERNEELERKVQSAESAPVNETPSYMQDNALHKVTSQEEMQKEVDSLNSLIEWAEESMDGEEQYDDEGNEYVAENDGVKYSKAELKKLRNNARKILRKDVPERQKWIQEKQQSDQLAVDTFDFLGDKESPDYAMYLQVKSSPLYAPLLARMPNANFAIGLMVEGAKTVKSRYEAQDKPKATRKPKAPVASTEAAVTAKTSPKSQREKSVQAARQQFEESGSMSDYQTYLRLKRET